MARLISPPEFADNAASAATLDALLAATQFSHTERVVLDIALRESRLPQPRDGWLARLSGRLFGARPQLPLGRERLEALRQYGMWLYRRGAGAVPAAVTTALVAAGYTADQIAVLQMTFAAFAPARTAAPRRGTLA